MPDAVLAHCWTGSPGQAWYPSFRNELEAEGWRVEVPELPETHAPSPAAWLSVFGQAVGPVHDELVLVGHSLGCATVLRYLESLPSSTPVGGVVLVAGFASPLGEPAIDPFHDGGFDWEKLGSRPEPKTVVLGMEDPYLRDRLHAESDCFARRLGASVLLVAGGGHFSHASGCRRLPEAAALVRLAVDRRGQRNGTN